MRHDVAKVRDPLQKEVLDKQKEIETQTFLTGYCNDLLEKIEAVYWKPGDDIRSKYTGKF